MIRVSVMYPKQEGGNFDYDYYINKHMVLVKERWGDALRGCEVHKGISGAGGTAETYVTVASLKFDDVSAFEAALAAHADEIMGDIVNFTNIDPTIQIEEQLMG
ncbi:MAG: EthD family reductase [Gammaproteobacteria bacterium]|nr:EthD family reductase [Gammaproteobacteria bacterium]